MTSISKNTRTLRIYTNEGVVFEIDCDWLEEYVEDTYGKKFYNSSNAEMYEYFKRLSFLEIVDNLRFVGFVDDRNLSLLSKCYFDIKEDPSGPPKKVFMKAKLNMLREFNPNDYKK